MLGPYELQRHDFSLPIDSGDADIVVALGRYRARDMGTVPVVPGGVKDRVVVVEEVPAVHVVHVAVPIVVDTVIRHFVLVDPNVVLQVRVLYVNACIYNGYDGARVPGRDSPRLRRVYIGVHKAAVRTGIVQAVDLRVAGIVGCRERLRRTDLVVRLGVLDVRRGLVAFYGFLYRKFLRQLHEHVPSAGELILSLGFVLTINRFDNLSRCIFLSLDQYPVRSKSGFTRRNRRRSTEILIGRLREGPVWLDPEPGQQYNGGDCE